MIILGYAVIGLLLLPRFARAVLDALTGDYLPDSLDRALALVIGLIAAAWWPLSLSVGVLARICFPQEDA